MNVTETFIITETKQNKSEKKIPKQTKQKNQPNNKSNNKKRMSHEKGSVQKGG